MGVDDPDFVARIRERDAAARRNLRRDEEAEGMDTQEICKILEVTRTNLGVLLHRVRNRLRECLEAKGIEP